jgi:hypothetical protein
MCNEINWVTLTKVFENIVLVLFDKIEIFQSHKQYTKKCLIDLWYILYDTFCIQDESKVSLLREFLEINYNSFKFYKIIQNTVEPEYKCLQSNPKKVLLYPSFSKFRI